MLAAASGISTLVNSCDIVIVLSTQAVKGQKMNWSGVHAPFLSMTTNLKSPVVLQMTKAGNEAGAAKFIPSCKSA